MEVSRLTPGLTQPLILRILHALPLGVMWQGHKASSSTKYSTEVKKGKAIPLHRGNFVFYQQVCTGHILMLN
jgi:hypothetical protein